MHERRQYRLSKPELAKLLRASKPVPYLAINCGVPSPVQETVNMAWAELAKKMDFDHMTVEPVEGDQRLFTAIPRSQ